MGPDGLQNTIQNIEELLGSVFNTTKKLSPLNVTDILCHCADSVLSGGLRRSAMIILFDPDDEEMCKCKTGNWFTDNPQRGRFNASAVLSRDDTPIETFHNLFSSTKQFGEPGFIWRSDKGQVYNPCCVSGRSRVLTKLGFVHIDELNVGDRIWSIDGWTDVVNILPKGKQPIYKYVTPSGTFHGTKDHKIVSHGEKVVVSKCDSIDALNGPIISHVDPNLQAIADGMAMASMSTVLDIDTHDAYTNSEIKDFLTILPNRLLKTHTYARIKTTITEEDLADPYTVDIPDKYMNGPYSHIFGFLRGLYSVGGEVIAKPELVVFRTISPKFRDNLQILLSSFGINSYFFIDNLIQYKEKNGNPTKHDVYTIVIDHDKNRFEKVIGFIPSSKGDRLNTSTLVCPRENYKVLYSEYGCTDYVYDIEVSNESHTYWCEGLNISNCEIGLHPVDPITGKTGFQFCNLISISGKDMHTEADFYKACKDAATLGTIQASYMDFDFLGEVTHNIVKADPLIGVSIGGIMCSPDLLLNTGVLYNGAQVVLQQNSKIAKILGINESSRCTCVKPDFYKTIIIGVRI